MGWKFALLGIVIGGVGVTAALNMLAGMNWEAPSEGTQTGTFAFLASIAAIAVGVALIGYGLFH